MTAGYLANGNTYEFKVTATASGRESAASNVVSVRPLPPLPAAPGNLRAAPQDSGDIELTWDALPTDVYYWVYWRVASSAEDFTKSKYPTEGTTAMIGSLTNGTVYEFKVTAENIAGEGPASTPVEARSKVALPEAPAFLDARANENLQIEPSWVAPGPRMYYWIYSRNVSAGQTGFTKNKYPTTATKATIGPLKTGDRYEFKVTAENAAGEGPPSNTADATVIGEAPARPGKLSATAGNGSIRLKWGASPTPNVGYWIYYRDADNGKPWQRLKYPVLDCCTHTVGLLTNGNTYEFRMTAGNAAGESGFTNVVKARPLPPSPKPPSNLRATAGNGKVTLAWNASPTPSVYYWIEHRVSGGKWKRAKYPVTKCCTFTVGYLANGTTYDFRVRATNVAGDSAPSNVDSARPLPPFPQAPSNLSASPGDGKVTLRWSASATAGVYHVVDYRKVGGAWKRMPYPITTCCTFTLSYLLNGTTYEFRVRATNLAGESGASNTDRARPMPPMPQARANCARSSASRAARSSSPGRLAPPAMSTTTSTSATRLCMVVGSAWPTLSWALR